jgi:hypothetical protein
MEDRRLIDRTSLSRTVDAVNAADFDGLPAGDREQAARWIAARQGLPGACGGTGTRLAAATPTAC